MTELRRANLNGVYDTHTNMMFYPKIMQPTHARWEHVPPPVSPAEAEQQQLTNGALPNGHPTLTNGKSSDAHPDAMDTEPATANNTHASATLFPPVPAPVSRNFTIIDTLFTSPPVSHPGVPGPDGGIADPVAGPNGLAAIPDDLVAELPEACRRALEAEREREVAWKRAWGPEARSALRGDLKIGFNGWPV